VKYEGVTCGLAIERPGRGVVVLRLTGWDTGEFGDAPMKEVAKDFGDRPLRLFIDARAVKGATIDVSNEWALWLRANRARFAQISMLAGSPFIQLTAKFVQRFADLGELMRIYTDPSAFDSALRAATSGKD
jgi:hypothetical protein